MARGFEVQSVAELQARLAAERNGEAFLMYRDGDGHQQLVTLGEPGEVPLGREVEPGVRLGWDPRVSRLHAVLECVGGSWTVYDDGFSRNGTFVNGSRVLGRRRLFDLDALRLGDVVIEFRDPATPRTEETIQAPDEFAAPDPVSPAQRRVLVALCRPLREPPFGPPATNKQIAAELTLSVDSVKTHLRRIADALGIEDLPQNEKRAALAWAAISRGIVSPRELLAEPDGRQITFG